MSDSSFAVYNGIQYILRTQTGIPEINAISQLQQARNALMEQINFSKVQQRGEEIAKLINSLTVPDITVKAPSFTNSKNEQVPERTFSEVLDSIANGIKNEEFFQLWADIGSLIEIRDGMIPTGTKFTITNSNLQLIYTYINRMQRGEQVISNLVGELGEMTAEIVVASHVQTLINDFIQSINDQTGITFTMGDLTVDVDVSNTGKFYVGTKAAKTDTQAHVFIGLQNQELAVELGVDNFTKTINYSEKANLRLGSFGPKRTKTGNITFRSTTLQHMLKATGLSGQFSGLYNALSYHIGASAGMNQASHFERIVDPKDQLFSKKKKMATVGLYHADVETYQSVRELFGVQLLKEMVEEQSDVYAVRNLQAIDFTVYGNKVFPEMTVFNHFKKLMESNQLLANIGYSELQRLYKTGLPLPEGTSEAVSLLQNARVSLVTSLALKEALQSL